MTNTERIAELVRRIETDLSELKAELAGNTSRVQRFIDARFFRVSGSVPFTDFYRAFCQSLTEGERADWGKLRVIQELAPLKVVDTGRADQPKKMIDGLSLVAPAVVAPAAAKIDPVNPDYDFRAMLNRIRQLVRNERKSYQEVATILNKEGVLDRKGNKWGWTEVRDVDAD